MLCVCVKWFVELSKTSQGIKKDMNYQRHAQIPHIR